MSLFCFELSSFLFFLSTFFLLVILKNFIIAYALVVACLGAFRTICPCCWYGQEVNICFYNCCLFFVLPLPLFCHLSSNSFLIPLQLCSLHLCSFECAASNDGGPIDKALFLMISGFNELCFKVRGKLIWCLVNLGMSLSMYFVDCFNLLQSIA